MAPWFLYMGERSPALISSEMEYCEIMLLIESSIYSWKSSLAYILFSIDNPYMSSDIGNDHLTSSGGGVCFFSKKIF